ncbi:MAG: RDD family protein [Spirochaetes bacterium]|nr:RDD family protein [Spirochaetota bacterium]
MEQFITGEKVKIDYEIAGIGLRIAAYCIDAAFQGLAFIFFYFIFIFSMAGSFIITQAINKDTGTASAVIMIIELILFLLFLLFLLFYRLFFELIWKGQTPGKKIMKIRVIQDDGTYLRTIPAVLRNLFRIIDGLPFNNIAGFIAMIANEKHKRIGDMVAGTIVIKEHQIVLPDNVKDIKLECFSEIRNLNELFSNNDKNIIRSYYLTKKDLDPVPYANIQNKIIDLISLKTGISRPANVSKDDFIMALYLLIK